MVLGHGYLFVVPVVSLWFLMRRGRRRLVLRRRLLLRGIVGIHFPRAVLIRPAVDHGLKIEIAMAGRARRLPLQRVGMPRIPPRGRAEEYAVEEINYEDNLRPDH